MRRALIVFAKHPKAGKVKTRLVPPLTYEEAKELYVCFVKDALIQYARIAEQLNVRIFLFISPENAVAYFSEMLGQLGDMGFSNHKIQMRLQTGTHLGEKIFDAFSVVFSEGYETAVITGTDHPTMPDDFLVQAFTCLDDRHTDSVIGPTKDGGFYLLGLKEIQKPYFENVEWSTSRVFKQTLLNLKSVLKSIVTLPEWYDVDEKKSLDQVLDEIGMLEDDKAPVYTKQFLKQLKAVEV